MCHVLLYIFSDALAEANLKLVVIMNFIDFIAPFFILHIFNAMDGMYRLWSFQNPINYNIEERMNLLKDSNYLKQNFAMKAVSMDVLGLLYLSEWEKNTIDPSNKSTFMSIIGYISLIILCCIFIPTLIPSFPLFGAVVKKLCGPLYGLLRLVVFIIVLRAGLAVSFNMYENKSFTSLVACETLGKTLEIVPPHSWISKEWFKKHKIRGIDGRPNCSGFLITYTNMRSSFKNTFTNNYTKIKDNLEIELLPTHNKWFFDDCKVDTSYANMVMGGWKRVALEDNATYSLIIMCTLLYTLIASVPMGVASYINMAEPTETQVPLHFLWICLFISVILVGYSILIWLSVIVFRKFILIVAKELYVSKPGNPWSLLLYWILNGRHSNNPQLSDFTESMGANFKSMFKNLIIPVLFSMMVGYFMTCIFLVYKENKTKQTKERLLQGVASKTPEELIEEENEMNDLLNERLKIYGSIFLFLSFIVSILIFTIYKGTEDGRQNGLEISFMFTIKVFASLVLAVYIVHLLFK